MLVLEALYHIAGKIMNNILLVVYSHRKNFKNIRKKNIRQKKNSQYSLHIIFSSKIDGKYSGEKYSQEKNSQYSPHFEGYSLVFDYKGILMNTF